MNDFGEGHAIESTIEEGFAFLESVRNAITAPLVSNFDWSIVEITNDKINTIKVSFEAEDIAIGLETSGIKRAELHFIPKIYEHLPSAAFPLEDEQLVALTPIDGVYDEQKEEFETMISARALKAS